MKEIHLKEIFSCPAENLEDVDPKAFLRLGSLAQVVWNNVFPRRREVYWLNASFTSNTTRIDIRWQYNDDRPTGSFIVVVGSIFGIVDYDSSPFFLAMRARLKGIMVNLCWIS